MICTTIAQPVSQSFLGASTGGRSYEMSRFGPRVSEPEFIRSRLDPGDAVANAAIVNLVPDFERPVTPAHHRGSTSLPRYGADAEKHSVADEAESRVRNKWLPFAVGLCAARFFVQPLNESQIVHLL